MYSRPAPPGQRRLKGRVMLIWGNIHPAVCWHRACALWRHLSYGGHFKLSMAIKYCITAFVSHCIIIDIFDELHRLEMLQLVAPRCPPSKQNSGWWAHDKNISNTEVTSSITSGKLPDTDLLALVLDTVKGQTTLWEPSFQTFKIAR